MMDKQTSEIFRKNYQYMLVTCTSWSEKPNLGQLEMHKGQKIEDKHAESWGQICWVLRWRRTTAAFTSFLFFLSYSFTSF
jgi:hypothetical protein